MAYSVTWIVGIVAVCAPLAARAYQRSVDKQRRLDASAAVSASENAI